MMDNQKPILLWDTDSPFQSGHLDGYESENAALIGAFERERSGPHARQSHLEQGRYENTYIDRTAIPEVEPVLSQIQTQAVRLMSDLLMGKAPRCGFWFNAMGPGEKTARHNHEEGDELLSGVYYLETPANSGDLVLYPKGEPIKITPEAGKFVLFSPKLAHSVTENLSTSRRLSLAFNFGPPTAP